MHEEKNDKYLEYLENNHKFEKFLKARNKRCNASVNCESNKRDTYKD